jgi:quercetin dioxygenase-like cupin family protein
MSSSSRIQEWGGTVREMHKGDVIWIPAGVKQWPEAV